MPKKKKATPIKSVVIPRTEVHEGYPGNRVTVYLFWVCPVCGGERGEPYETISFDGSRKLNVSGWQNPCGHVDKYSAAREEARANGLNQPEYI